MHTLYRPDISVQGVTRELGKESAAAKTSGKAAGHQENPALAAGIRLQISFSGHRKNFYGVEEMCVADNPDARKLIDVSDKMKQRVFHSVKDAFYKYNGMSGDNEAEWEEVARQRMNIIKH